jgi:hypothetical protein
MRKLIVAAVTAAALAAPSGASAGTAGAQTCVTPVFHCVLEAYREQVAPLVDCVISACGVPQIDADPVCHIAFGQPCTRRSDS